MLSFGTVQRARSLLNWVVGADLESGVEQAAVRRVACKKHQISGCTPRRPETKTDCSSRIGSV